MSNKINLKVFGFTLFEIVFASALSSIILLSMLTLLHWSENNILQQHALLSAINKIRFVNYYLTKKLKTNVIKKLSHDYLTVLSKTGKTTYFIAKLYTNDQNDKPIYALFEREGNKRRLELARFIKKMHVKYFGEYVQVTFLSTEKRPYITKSHYFIWQLLINGIHYA